MILDFNLNDFTNNNNIECNIIKIMYWNRSEKNLTHW